MEMLLPEDHMTHEVLRNGMGCEMMLARNGEIGTKAERRVWHNKRGRTADKGNCRCSAQGR